MQGTASLSTLIDTMAMMDDPVFLVSHIRNSFITSDDTGMCELIIDLDDGISRQAAPAKHDGRPVTWHPKQDYNGLGQNNSAPEADTELSHSYDILADMEFASHRGRSNTSVRLEQLKKEKLKQSKIKHIQWKTANHPIEEIGELFEKEIVQKRDSKVKSVSLLSKRLESYNSSTNNPFIEYAKFDGKGTTGIPTKKIAVFLTMALPHERAYPMIVVTLASAKVQDLIGLICWQYAKEFREPSLKDKVDYYSLHIAEDDGEVDMDFPALDPREPFSKFAFPKLALVENETPTPCSSKDATVVTINIPSKGFSKVTIKNTNVTMRELMENLIERRQLKYRGLKYRLEKQNEPGVEVDLESPLCNMDTHEYCLVRENSVRDGSNTEAIPSNMHTIPDLLNSHHYKSYMVSMQHKLSTSNRVQLGISGEKLEIDPVAQKGKLVNFKQKPLTYDMENIADCVLQEEKSSGKSSFRLVYHSSHDFKHHDFECDTAVAKEIVLKIINILEIKGSPLRKEYFAQKEKKKSQKRHTIAF